MVPRPQKILVIRLSSIGDIVLTSPILRSLRHCFPHARIHFLTKRAYEPLLSHNPHLDHLHLFDGDLAATHRELQAQEFDQLIDLHCSIRSRILKLRLRIPSTSYSKDRWPVLLYAKFKVGKLPQVHTVERYERAILPLGCALDGGGLEFYLSPEARNMATDLVRDSFSEPPIAVVLGGNYFTKRWPREYFVDLLNALGLPAILLGGKPEQEDAAWIAPRLAVPCLNAVARYDLMRSAALLEPCRYVIAHDTGLMHIATALGLKVYSIWGNTVPELGFSPYQAVESVMIENKGLSCRPCTKLGHAKCPKGHFKCMMEITPARVLDVIRSQ